MKNNHNNSKSFEEYLKELENIVSEMESGNIPLDKALEMYERGINISQYCIKELEKAELKLKKLSKKIDGSFELEDID
ncbi:MAG TPA: exodeoxyribonuclease VII small subunit [Ignavibacteria bacterium]|jgi:exodeoxyribonuclease VII small subunit